MNTFVVIDGPNGSGKTSLIKDFKNKTNYTTLSVPAGTELADFLRPICRGTDGWEHVDPFVRSLLFHAARNDEYVKKVKDQPGVKIADRWWTSTYVYQICLAKIPIQQLEANKYPNEKIDLVILLDGKDEVLIDRVYKERESNKLHGHDLWTEKETLKKVIEAYRRKLPEYLSSINIPYVVFDTTDTTTDEAFIKVKNIINTLYKFEPF